MLALSCPLPVDSSIILIHGMVRFSDGFQFHVHFSSIGRSELHFKLQIELKFLRCIVFNLIEFQIIYVLKQSVKLCYDFKT